MFSEYEQIRRRSEALQNEQLRLARAIYRNVQEGVVITDLLGRIIAVNPAFAAISEFPEGDLISRHVRLFRPRGHDRSFYSRIRRSLLLYGSWEGELWSRRRNDEVFPEWVRITSVADSSGLPAFLVWVVVDISRMNHAQSQLNYMAHHDALTGLPNRALLQLRLRHSISRALRTGGSCAVLFLDLDGFKRVNDSMGHAAGDELLQQVAARLRSRVRENDTLARLGGDEFVLVMEGIANRRDADRMAESLIHQLSHPFVLARSGESVSVAASIGISCCPENAIDAETLLHQADQALYDAKSAGRGTWRSYEPTAILPALTLEDESLFDDGCVVADGRVGTVGLP